MFKKGKRFRVGTDISKDFSVVSIRTFDKKAIYYDSTNEFFYFDLKVDPKERNALNGEDVKDELKWIESMVINRIEEIKNQKAVNYRKIDDEKKKMIMERLRALGYIEE